MARGHNNIKGKLLWVSLNSVGIFFFLEDKYNAFLKDILH